MIYFLNTILVLILFFLFAFLHSYFASKKFKILLLNKYPSIIPFYRLIYNLFAVITFYLFYKLSPKSDLTIYDLIFPYDLLILIPQLLSLIGLIWSAFYFDWKEFIGISQIIRWEKGNYNLYDLDEKTTLRVDGPYKISRHPIYLFTILFLLFRPTMSLFYLTVLVCIIIYFYIGSIYEEKKLVEKFGSEYLNYQEKVGKIFPFKFQNKS